MPSTRRKFLNRASDVIAGAFSFANIVPASVHGASKPAPGNRITMGFIGTGGRGNWNLKSFMNNSDVEVLAICDVDTNQRKKTRQRLSLPQKSCYNDYRELLARDDIDAVVISTPDHWHVPIAVAAAKAGKDIFCEKPMSLTIAEGRTLSDTVKRYGRILQVGSQQRSDSRFNLACELVQKGKLGKLKIIKVGLPGSQISGPQPIMPIPEGFDYDMWLGPAPWKPYTKLRCHGKFRHSFDYSGGKFIDWGAHHLDIVQMALAADDSGPVEISGWGVFPKEGIYDTAITYDINYTYANGARVNASTNGPNGILFEGTEGKVFVNRGIIQVEPKSLISPRDIRRHRRTEHLRNFLDCIKNRKTPAAPVEFGHRSATVCHLGNIAMLLGRKLTWNPQTEEFINDDQANRMRTRSRRSPWTL